MHLLLVILNRGRCSPIMIDEERHISTNFGYDVLAEQTYDNELFDLWSYEKLGIKSPNLPDDKIATIVPEK